MYVHVITRSLEEGSIFYDGNPEYVVITEHDAGVFEEALGRALYYARQYAGASLSQPGRIGIAAHYLREVYGMTLLPVDWHDSAHCERYGRYQPDADELNLYPSLEGITPSLERTVT